MALRTGKDSELSSLPFQKVMNMNSKNTAVEDCFVRYDLICDEILKFEEEAIQVRMRDRDSAKSFTTMKLAAGSAFF